jgi:quercetin dioxygenase-like cupin family protein
VGFMERLEIINLAQPTETREFSHGRLEVFEIAGQVIGRASYDPGWRWSEHVGPLVGTELCQTEHLGLVISGRCAVKMADGTETTMGPGDLFAIPPGHDSWVVGDEPYVSVHFSGAETYGAGEST